MVLALALPQGAAAASAAPVGAGEKVLSTLANGRDRVTTRPRALWRVRGSRVDWTSYPIAGGYSVRAASAHYSSSQVAQVIAVLGTLPHGAEMNSLSVYVAAPQEISGTCGPETLGCYYPDQGRMVVSGSNDSVAGVSRDHVIAHEYGHHIANNRVNDLPWSPLDAGTERWATYEHVCERTQQGSLFPGDEAAHYWQNPGEGFAESYADMTKPVTGLAWDYSPLLAPDPTALSLIALDVTQPWSGSGTTVWRGKLGPRHARAVRMVGTPLDGNVTVQMSGPKDSSFALSVHGAARAHRVLLARRSPRRRSAEQIDANVCGQRTVQLQVHSRRGSGHFEVKITHP